jgi:hypothetical protein
VLGYTISIHCSLVWMARLSLYSVMWQKWYTHWVYTTLGTCSSNDKLTRWMKVKAMIPYWCHLLIVFTGIINIFLSQSAVPTCFKLATIVPVPKKAKVTDLKDYLPVALTSVIIKCFERLVKDHITSSMVLLVKVASYCNTPCGLPQNFMAHYLIVIHCYH